MENVVSSLSGSIGKILRLKRVLHPKWRRTGGQRPEGLELPHLPAELWLNVIDVLGNSELSALAASCRSLRCLIHSKAPFRTVTLFNDNPKRTRVICRDPILLLSAATINWRMSAIMDAPISTIHFASLLSEACTPFRNLLQTLSPSTSLYHLTLHDIDVAPAQQETILALKNLRSLTLVNTNFLESDQQFPVSRIQSLQIHGDVRVGPSIHILSHLAPILDTFGLELFGRLPNEFNQFLSSMEFPVLQRVSFSHISRLTSLRALSSAHIVSIDSHHGFERCKPSRVFPALHTLVAPPYDENAIAGIVQDRPVRIYHQHNISGLLFLEDVLNLLRPLKLSRVPLTELRIFICWKVRSFLQMLASELPALTRLELYVGRYRYDRHAVRDGKIDWGFLTKCWPEHEASMDEAHLMNLQMIRVCFTVPGTGDPPTIFPVDPCRTLFEHFIKPICPELRRAEFIALSHHGVMDDIDARPLEPNECLILGRAAPHVKWEERGFGALDISDEDTRTPMRCEPSWGSSASASSSE